MARAWLKVKKKTNKFPLAIPPTIRQDGQTRLQETKLRQSMVHEQSIFCQEACYHCWFCSGSSGNMCIRHGRRYFWFSSCAIVMRSRWGNSSSTVRRLMSQPMHDEELHRKLYDRADHVWVIIFLAAVRIYTPITGHSDYAYYYRHTTTTTVTTSTTASTAAATWRNHLEEAGRVV